jgi:signal transduction histidine kinase
VHQDSIQLQVEDNGSGINENKSNGIGLKSIQSRVQYHKGKITIDSGKLGTTFIIEIPINNGY